MLHDTLTAVIHQIAQGLLDLLRCQLDDLELSDELKSQKREPRSAVNGSAPRDFGAQVRGRIRQSAFRSGANYWGAV